MKRLIYNPTSDTDMARSWERKTSLVLPLPSAPCATPLCLNKAYCAVLPLMTTVPGTTEPEPGLYGEGDPAMITFSTQGSKSSGTHQGQSKL